MVVSGCSTPIFFESATDKRGERAVWWDVFRILPGVRRQRETPLGQGIALATRAHQRHSVAQRAVLEYLRGRLGLHRQHACADRKCGRLGYGGLGAGVL